MTKVKSITRRILDDIETIYDNFDKIEKLRTTKGLSDQEYMKKVYLEVIKAVYLGSVVENAQNQGIKFNKKDIDHLEIITETISEIVDFKKMGDLTKDDEKSVFDFAIKHIDIIPTEDLDEIFSID